MNRDEMISVMRDLSTRLGLPSVSRPNFLKETGLSERQVLREFGTYNALVEAAGLKPTHFPTSDAPIYSDEALLTEIVRVLRLPDSKLTRIFFEQEASVSPSACERRFGGWRNALRKAADLLEPDREAGLVARVREYTSTALPPHPPDRARTDESTSPPIANQHAAPVDSSPTVATPIGNANLYGDFINFRGLQHAPVNEQGVVFLFGMICRELRYVVEIVRSGFPDCEAKRQIPGSTGRWQRVRIEFEFESRSFRAHGHDPNQCDVIVCWEHNWADCPIEVLELRSAMNGLSPTAVT